MKHMKLLAGLTAFGSIVATASAGLVDVRYDLDQANSAYAEDGTIAANEYGAGNGQSYAGAGAGFGGTLGQGRIYMDYSAADLNIGVSLGNNLNDNIVLLLDTRAGGQTDASMDDQADGGRRISSNLTRDVDDPFDANFLPDFSVVIGSFGIVVFELTPGNTADHLAFRIFEGNFTGNASSLAREINLPRALLGLTSPTAGFNWLAGYGSNDPFMSDEAIPAQPWSGLGNPGFNNGDIPLRWENYNRFEAVPEPGTMLALGAGIAALVARRRKRA